MEVDENGLKEDERDRCFAFDEFIKYFIVYDVELI